MADTTNFSKLSKITSIWPKLSRQKYYLIVHIRLIRLTLIYFQSISCQMSERKPLQHLGQVAIIPGLNALWKNKLGLWRPKNLCFHIASAVFWQENKPADEILFFFKFFFLVAQQPYSALPWLISNVMHKIIIYLHIIHLLKSSTYFEHYFSTPCM